MSRIVYLAFPTGAVSGGQKMILRHVETLRDLGFDAVYWHGPRNAVPPTLAHRAPVEVGTPFRDDDILVVPSDGPNAIRTAAAMAQRSLIFCQAHLTLAAMGFDAIDAYPADRPPVLIAVGPSSADLLRRAYPHLTVEIIPCFADERVFRPGPARQPGVACAIQKRPREANAIENLFRRLYPDRSDMPWTRLEKATEAEVAEVLGVTTQFLNLARLEAIGLTALEAMASGCICAGFTGIGGRDIATPENGFWVEEDDCLAAAQALAEAAELVRAGGPALDRMREAGFETARQWSYAAFRPVLEEFWMRHAPEARRQSGPLD